ncbi:MAG: 30S ribosomal protein S3 [Candidatus Omnitrophota bacterium]
MGQKVNPISFRIGYIRTWSSRWFANKRDYPVFLQEDLKIRKYIKKSLAQAAVSKVEIERTSEKVRVIIFTARPGIIIGRKGADIDRLRDELQSMTHKEVLIDIKEINNPAADAQLISENVAFQLEKRIAVRRAMKKAIQAAMRGGALGVKVMCSGRLGGAEMCRTEKYRQGKIPLHTIRADIDYGFAEAFTTYGLIGVKCWLYKGDIIKTKQKEKEVGVISTKTSQV